MNYPIQSLSADRPSCMLWTVYDTPESRDDYIRRRLPYRTHKFQGNKRLRKKKAKALLHAEWLAVRRVQVEVGTHQPAGRIIHLVGYGTDGIKFVKSIQWEISQ